MKIFEVLRRDIKPVTEQQIINQMKSFDWNFEFSDSPAYLAKVNKDLEILENRLYSLWKKNPDRAIEIWNENCPASPRDKSTIPSFIFRLEAQEI